MRSSCTCSNELPLPITSYFSSFDRLDLLLFVISFSAESVVVSRHGCSKNRHRLVERTKQTKEQAGVDISAGRMQITAQHDSTRPYGGPLLSARSRSTKRLTLTKQLSWRSLRMFTCLQSLFFLLKRDRLVQERFHLILL